MSSRMVPLAVLLAVLVTGGCTASTEVPEPVQSESRAISSMTLASLAFRDGEPLPLQHATTSAGGKNVSPPLAWSGAPEATRSFALEVVDLHPIARSWVHWLVTDIPPRTTSLGLDASRSGMPAGARQLRNGFGDAGWGGPQPPRGSGVHDYRFTIYALDTPQLGLDADVSLDEFRRAAEQHVVGSGSMTGTFER